MCFVIKMRICDSDAYDMAYTQPRYGFRRFESAYSCIHKIAWLNHIGGKIIRSVLAGPSAGQSDVTWTKEGVDLNTATHLSIPALETLLQLRDEGIEERFTPFYDFLPRTSVEQKRQYYSPVLRYCPKCIAEGFHSPLSQLSHVRACPIHGELLLDACQICGEQIQYALTVSSLNKPFACKNGHTLWSGIANSIHLDSPSADTFETINNYLKFREEIHNKAIRNAWGFSISTRVENRKEPFRATPSPSYWNYYVASRPPVGMFVFVQKSFTRTVISLDKSMLANITDNKMSKNAVTMKLLMNVDPNAHLLHECSQAVSRKLLRKALPYHRQCLHMPHDAIRDLLDRRRMPCDFMESFVAWLRLLGAPSIWARGNERGCRELWPYRMDRFPPRFAILQAINTGLLRLYPFIRDCCNEDRRVSVDIVAEYTSRVIIRQILVSVFMKCHELLHTKDGSLLNLERLNELTPEMLIPYVHVSYRENKSGPSQLMVDVWESHLDDRLLRAVSADTGHQEGVSRIVDKWLRFARFGLLVPK